MELKIVCEKAFYELAIVKEGIMNIYKENENSFIFEKALNIKNHKICDLVDDF